MLPFDEESLLGVPAVGANEVLRGRLLARTAGKVRFRRRMRQAKTVGLVCLIYAAGAGTLALVRSPEVRIERKIVRVEIPTVVKDLAPPRPTAEQEWEADRQFIMLRSIDHYRVAGDKHLDQGDHKAALRCYRKFLVEANQDDLKPAPADNWLLATLKRSRTSD